jgi:hypothetical protein
MLMANKMYSFYNLTQASIIVACDGESALYMVLHSEQKIKLSMPDYDLLMAICYALLHLKITWQAMHVQGHQDEQKPYEELTRAEILNWETDKAENKLQSTSGQI